MSEATLDVLLRTTTGEVGGGFEVRVIRQLPIDDLVDTDDDRAEAVRLSIGYRTEGRGNTDEATVDQLTFDISEHGRLDTVATLSIPFHAPVSYDGRLIRVLWHIEARVDLRWQRDEIVTVPVLVVPRGGASVYRYPHPLRSSG